MAKATTKPRVEVYATGLCACSACVENGTEENEIEREVNAHSPTGISSRWEISDDDHFSGGPPMPYPCPEAPEERSHWLLNC